MTNDNINGKLTQAEMEILLDDLQKNLPVMMQKTSLDAQLLRKKYNSLVESGFSEQESLEIIKARPLYE